MLKGKVALVTGGAGGIGSAIVRELDSQGVNVAVHVNTSVHEGKALAASVDGTVHYADLTDPAGPQRLIDSVLGKHARIDILVNNAGTVGAAGPWHSQPVDEMARVACLNLYAPLQLSQMTMGLMGQFGWGRIVNISSIYGTHGSPYVLPYSLSKAGLDSMTRALAIDGAGSGVTVNAIAPGNVDTPMTRRAGDDYVTDVIAKTPLQRLGDPEEVASAVSFLVKCGFVTGQVLVIDGGLSLVR